MTGLLSQTLANLQTAMAHLNTLKNMPAGAVTLQASITKEVKNFTPHVSALQVAASSFCTSSIVDLTKALEIAKGDAPITGISPMIQSVQNQAVSLQDGVNAATSEVGEAITNFPNYANSLAAVVSQLNSEKAVLQGKALAARNEAAAKKKSYYWLFALGPFGLLGLAAALTAWQIMKKQVNELEQQDASLTAQATQLLMMTTAMGQLSTDITTLAVKVSQVKNAVDILAGDVTAIIADIQNAKSTRVEIQMYLSGALAEVTSLQVDAS